MDNCFTQRGNISTYSMFLTKDILTILQWNPDFSKPRFFEPSDYGNKNSFSLGFDFSRCYPRFSESISASLGGFKTRDSTVHSPNITHSFIGGEVVYVRIYTKKKRKENGSPDKEIFG